jgi:hypothetical protein
MVERASNPQGVALNGKRRERINLSPCLVFFFVKNTYEFV